jgi:hypothetical protein
MYSALNHHVMLFGATIGVVLTLAGCGGTTGAPSGVGSDRRCGETVHAGEYACVDGQQPRNHEARDCFVYGSAYRIDFWRCDAGPE